PATVGEPDAHARSEVVAGHGQTLRHFCTFAVAVGRCPGSAAPLARLRGFAVFSGVRSLFINELAEKVFTTSGGAGNSGGSDPGRGWPRFRRRSRWNSQTRGWLGR